MVISLELTGLKRSRAQPVIKHDGIREQKKPWKTNKNIPLALPLLMFKLS